MLVSDQLEGYFRDLAEPDLETSLALVHSRFSTNTFPSWERAHPYRYVIHNGEINTLRGNVNWLRAQEHLLESDLFGSDIKKVLPIIQPDGSDSAMFDNCLEFLLLTGRSLPHVMMMMIPEPWSHHETMEDEKRAFYEYHANLMEPWDGPAAMGFHRRRRDRRRARPQRPASGALLRHQRRPGRHGLRGGRARHPAREWWPTRAASSRAGCSWSTPRQGASSATRRSSTRWPPSTPTASG